jgi:hypothetical protein
MEKDNYSKKYSLIKVYDEMKLPFSKCTYFPDDGAEEEFSIIINNPVLSARVVYLYFYEMDDKSQNHSLL